MSGVILNFVQASNFCMLILLHDTTIHSSAFKCTTNNNNKKKKLISSENGNRRIDWNNLGTGVTV